MAPQYTVQRIRKDNKLYGPTHASSDGFVTLCGFDLDWQWTIITNDSDGEFNCRNCIRVFNSERGE